LEALCLELWLVPAVSGDSVPHLSHNRFIAQIQKPGALRRLQPLVRGGCIEVASNVVDVQPHHAGNMGSVKRGADPLGAGQRGDLLHRQHYAGSGTDMADKNDARARRNSIVDAVENLRGVLGRFWYLEFLYDAPIPLGPQVPGLLPA